MSATQKSANTTDKAVKATRKPGECVSLTPEAIAEMNAARPIEVNPFTVEAQKTRKWSK